MRDAAFRDWLNERTYRGSPLTRAANASRLSWIKAVARSLPELGFSEHSLDEVHASGRWGELLSALAALRSNWRTNEAAARRIAPEANDPTGQIANARAAVSLYGHFADGKGPNYAAGESAEDRFDAALGEMREIFLARTPDFRDFTQTSGSYWKAEREYKDVIVARCCEIAASALDDAAAGHAIYDALTPQVGPPLRWQTIDAIHKGLPTLAAQFDAVLGRLARSDEPIVDAIAKAASELEALQGKGLSSLSHGEMLAIIFTVAAAIHPDQSAFFKVLKARKLLKELGQSPLFRTPPSKRDEIAAWLALLQRIFTIMADEWGWRPRDLLDVQGFAWVVLNDHAGDERNGDVAGQGEAEVGFAMQRKETTMPGPTNLILYGPPGTGKTYATAAEAVRLCGEPVPEDRETLMALYRLLYQQGRIDFVTFHQNFSYEDFVEGLRPVAGQGEERAAGFELRPEPGIFRRMAEAAARPIAQREAAFQLEGRRIFKLSLGEAGKREWEWVYEQSIEDGYALFGFRDIDWSDARFLDRNEILRELQEKYPDEKITFQTGLVKSPDRFRNQMSVGDVVVVSKGLNAFRAIGVVEGDYEYAPRPEGRYCHRRKVRWLWEDPQGVPVEEINAKRFSLDTVYELPKDRLNLAAIERHINSGEGGETGGELLPHVLIVDEINRANISKVFGELITLLEPDKRLGMPNALTVRLPYSKREFGVPANLHIIGTMNTADRSIAQLDTALRRRFVFREITPDPSLLPTELDGLPLRRVLETINDRIEYLVDREHRIGHAFFIDCKCRGDVDAVMRNKVIPLLQEYFFEDWANIAAVLGELKGGGFLACRELCDPSEHEREARLSWSVRDAFTMDAYDRLVGKGPIAVAEGRFADAGE